MQAILKTLPVCESKLYIIDMPLQSLIQELDKQKSNEKSEKKILNFTFCNVNFVLSMFFFFPKIHK